jgi:hypothetical protein
MYDQLEKKRFFTLKKHFFLPNTQIPSRKTKKRYVFVNYILGIRNMLEEGKSDDLSRLFGLFSEVEKGLVPIAEEMKNYIIELGDGYITESKEEKENEKSASKHVRKKSYFFNIKNVIPKCVTRTSDAPHRVYGGLPSHIIINHNSGNAMIAK